VVEALVAAAGRRRAAFVALALATIVVGLVVNRHGLGLGAAARDVAGDALWAAMAYWWIGALAPAAPAPRRAGAAYAVCVAVELQQLVRTPALDALRRTLPGRLVLGSGFDPRDLAAYAAGVAAAFLLERAARRG
jgi:hypothetical protein